MSRASINTLVIRGINGSDGKGIASTSYNAATGVLTITFSDNSTYQTSDLRGQTGAAGKGISSTSYNSGTGVLTITFTDSTTYQTGDLRGITTISSGLGTNITGLLKGNGSTVSAATPGTDFVAPNDSRLTDARTPTDSSVTYGKVAAALKQKSSVSSTIDLSANGIGEITLSANTAFTFTGFQLNKTYLLKIVANGYTPSWATAAKHIAVDGNAAFATTGTFYVSLTCIDATSGSEKLLTIIMKGA